MQDRPVEQIADGLVFPEGPRWREGALFVSDMHDRKVIVIEPHGRGRTMFELDGRPSGLGFAPDGSLLVVEMVSRRILRWNGTELGVHADLGGLASFPLNDMVVDAKGRCYVGSLGVDPWRGEPDRRLPDTARSPESISTAPIFLVHPNGSSEIAAPGLRFPNGMALSASGTELFVAETYGHRVSRMRVDAAGGLSSRRTLAAFAPRHSATVPEALASGWVMPDGIALDRRGAVWVADANGSGALKLARDGRIVDRLMIEGFAIYAVALSDDGRWLCACAAPRLQHRHSHPPRSGAIFRCDLGIDSSRGDI